MFMSIHELARDYYETHRITFDKLASISATLFGQEVTSDVLRQWSSDDGGWKKADISHRDKLEFLASIVFDRIEEEHPRLSVNELTTLINSYRDLIVKAVPPQEVTSSRPVLQDITVAARQALLEGKDELE